jgi:hypothetical protein
MEIDCHHHHHRSCLRDYQFATINTWITNQSDISSRYIQILVDDRKVHYSAFVNALITHIPYNFAIHNTSRLFLDRDNLKKCERNVHSEK